MKFQSPTNSQRFNDIALGVCKQSSLYASKSYRPSARKVEEHLFKVFSIRVMHMVYTRVTITTFDFTELGQNGLEIAQ